jgi:hypothetical protein
MLLDANNFGGWHDGPLCCSCKNPISQVQRSVHVDFANDPSGHKGLTGLYHADCSKPFVSMARAMNMLSAGRG